MPTILVYRFGLKRNQRKYSDCEVGTLTLRAVASPTQPGEGGEKISGGAKYLSSFLKYEVKNMRKSAEDAKT